MTYPAYHLERVQGCRPCVAGTRSGFRASASGCVRGRETALAASASASVLSSSSPNQIVATYFMRCTRRCMRTKDWERERVCEEGEREADVLLNYANCCWGSLRTNWVKVVTCNALQERRGQLKIKSRRRRRRR